MAKKKTTEPAGIGHNKAISDDMIVGWAQEMAEIDAQRKVLNRQASEIRQLIKDKGGDTDAFKDVYAYFKKKRHERDGYDEAHKQMWDALNKADTADMFAFQDEKD